MYVEDVAKVENIVEVTFEAPFEVAFEAAFEVAAFELFTDYYD